MIAEWGGVYEKLQNAYDQCGGKRTVDSAFGSERYDFLIKSEEYITNSEATSMRQSAEWGMGLLRSSFRRMRDRLRFDDLGERKLTFRMYFLLFNYRSNSVGINQIRNVYMPQVNNNANDLLRDLFTVLLIVDDSFV